MVNLNYFAFWNHIVHASNFVFFMKVKKPFSSFIQHDIFTLLQGFLDHFNLFAKNFLVLITTSISLLLLKVVLYLGNEIFYLNFCQVNIIIVYFSLKVYWMAYYIIYFDDLAMVHILFNLLPWNNLHYALLKAKFYLFYLLSSLKNLIISFWLCKLFNFIYWNFLKDYMNLVLRTKISHCLRNTFCLRL